MEAKEWNGQQGKQADAKSTTMKYEVSAVEEKLSEIHYTFTSTLNLPTAVQSIIDKVRQTPIQVHRCQAALKSITWGHQLREVAVHALS